MPDNGVVSLLSCVAADREGEHLSYHAQVSPEDATGALSQLTRFSSYLLFRFFLLFVPRDSRHFFLFKMEWEHLASLWSLPEGLPGNPDAWETVPSYQPTAHLLSPFLCGCGWQGPPWAFYEQCQAQHLARSRCSLCSHELKLTSLVCVDLKKVPKILPWPLVHHDGNSLF